MAALDNIVERVQSIKEFIGSDEGRFAVTMAEDAGLWIGVTGLGGLALAESDNPGTVRSKHFAALAAMTALVCAADFSLSYANFVRDIDKKLAVEIK